MGFMAVKGLTERTLRRLIRARAERPFHGLADFYARVRPGQAEAEALVLVGAFDRFGRARPQLLWELELPRRFLSTISWAAFVIAGLIVANIISIVVRERAQKVESIRAIGEGRSAILSYTVVEALLLGLSGGALGVLAAVPGGDSAGVCRRLKERGILVRYYQQDRLTDKLRITIGTDAQNAALVEALDIPVIGNGDVDSPDAAVRMFGDTGCDAVMIGRASMKNPWIYRQTADLLAG